MTHPSCDHPVVNGSDDYPCPDVTPEHLRDHQLWELELWAVAR